MKRLVVAVMAIVAVLLAGCGSSAPTDRQLIQSACRQAPGYDWDAQTVNGSGAVTGLAECGSDGSVASWVRDPRGRGDKVMMFPTTDSSAQL